MNKEEKETEKKIEKKPKKEHNPDDFTLTDGIDPIYQEMLDSGTFKRKGIKDRMKTNKEERENHDKQSTDQLDRSESTWRKLEKKGLHPLKNLDVFFFFFFCAGYLSVVKLVEWGHYKGAFVAGFLAGVCATSLYLCKKGDLAIIFREYVLVFLSKIGKKSEKEIKKQSNQSIWGRIDRE